MSGCELVWSKSRKRIRLPNKKIDAKQLRYEEKTLEFSGEKCKFHTNNNASSSNAMNRIVDQMHAPPIPDACVFGNTENSTSFIGHNLEHLLHLHLGEGGLEDTIFQ